MARWELANAHYLKVEEPCEWEHNETNLVTGKANRQRFPVPMYLEKGTNVCHGRGSRGDVTFIGDPTPDMIPLDDEAQTISDSFQQHWSFKPDSVGEEYSQSLIKEMADKMTQPVQIEGIAELVTAVGAMTKQNQEIINGLAGRRL